MNRNKEDPKGLEEGIRRALDITCGAMEVFPGGTLKYENTDNILDLWYRKEWRVGNTKVVLEAVISVLEA